MHHHHRCLLFFFFLLLTTTTTTALSSPAPPQEQEREREAQEPKDLDFWCHDTPHPKACEYYLARSRTSPALVPPKDQPHFYQLSLSAALARASRARRRLRHLTRQLRAGDAHAAHALSDCEKLYANTVLQLNRTARRAGSRSSTFYDSQTWLSAALTNLNMCSKNLATLGAAESLIAPLKRYNVTDLISNCLAINRPAATIAGALSVRRRLVGGFPDWVGKAERRILLGAGGGVSANLVVAKDGSGGFNTLKAAVAAAAKMRRSGRLVIYVKAGVYTENVQIASGMNDITLVGDGKGRTIITGSASVTRGFTLITSATLAVFADGFVARDLTIRNTYGPGSQAVALLLASDRSVVYKASIEGYQDTLLLFSQRQFYRECDILGTIDFIFGNAAAVLQSCNILVRRPLHGESNVITAQGRSDPNQNTGIVIQSSTISYTPEFLPVRREVRTFLGRPWMKYSRTIYMQNYMGSVVDPQGWLPWNGDFALSTLYYAEFRNTGPGSRMSRRVKWPGYHVVVKPSVVAKFTVGNFIAGGMWIPPTGMPFNSGL